MAAKKRSTARRDALIACATGDVATLGKLLDEDAVPVDDGREFTWLAHAAHAGQVDVVRLLLARGASPRTPCHAEGPLRAPGATALHAAVANMMSPQRAPIAELLLAHGADVDARDADGSTPLMLALVQWRGAEAVVRVLLDHGADVSLVDAYGKSVRSRAMDGSVFAKLLDERGARRTDGDDDALLRAVGRGDRATVLALLAKGVSANARERTSEGRPALVAACARGDGDVALALLAHGADANAAENDVTRDGAGFTALMMASYRGMLDVVDALLAKGADRSPRNQVGDALAYAQLGRREGHAPGAPWDDVVARLRRTS